MKSAPKISKFIQNYKNLNANSHSGREANEKLTDAYSKKDKALLRDTAQVIQENFLQPGIAEIINGKPEGWVKVTQYAYHYGLIRCLHGIYDSGTAEDVASIILYLLGFGDNKFCEYLKSSLIEYLEEEDEEDIEEETQEIIAYALACLSLHSNGKTPKYKGRYQNLLIEFNAKNIDNDLLTSLLDYHLENMGLGEGDGIQFMSFGIIPIEFFPLNFLRRGENIGPIKPDHPLFNLDFGVYPGSSSYNPYIDEVFKIGWPN